MMQTVWIIGIVGLLAVSAYFIINATSTGSDCTGTWTDLFNPSCWAAAGSAEINTILIILAAVVIIVVGLVAFGPSTAGAVKAFA
jgi:hypothetical protein